jgi:hypothetical protein
MDISPLCLAALAASRRKVFDIAIVFSRVGPMIKAAFLRNNFAIDRCSSVENFIDHS